MLIVIPSVEGGQLGQMRSSMLPMVVARLLRTNGKGWMKPERLMSTKSNDPTLQAVSNTYGVEIGDVVPDIQGLSIISSEPDMMDEILGMFHPDAQLPVWPQERHDILVVLDGPRAWCKSMDIGLPTDREYIPDGWNVSQSRSVLLRFTLTAILVGLMGLMLYLVI